MDQRIMDDDILAPWQRRQQRRVGGEAGGKIERGFGTIKRSGFRFQRLMLRMIAAQQARTARAASRRASLSARPR